MELLKEVLKAVYVSEIVKGKVDTSSLSKKVGRTPQYLEKLLLCLEEMGLIKRDGEETYMLSPQGREMIKVVLTGGVFDIIHIGHIAALKEAEGLGDLLVVVVARDEIVERVKGKKPINSEDRRVELVAALKPVDLALLGDPEDIFKTVERVRPDIIAIGYDQRHDEDELKRGLEERRMRVSITRLKRVEPGVKSSQVLSKIEHLNTI